MPQSISFRPRKAPFNQTLSTTSAKPSLRFNWCIRLLRYKTPWISLFKTRFRGRIRSNSPFNHRIRQMPCLRIRLTWVSRSQHTKPWGREAYWMIYLWTTKCKSLETPTTNSLNQGSGRRLGFRLPDSRALLRGAWGNSQNQLHHLGLMHKSYGRERVRLMAQITPLLWLKKRPQNSFRVPWWKIREHKNRSRRWARL
jgi:hypothetical protein